MYSPFDDSIEYHLSIENNKENNVSKTLTRQEMIDAIKDCHENNIIGSTQSNGTQWVEELIDTGNPDHVAVLESYGIEDTEDYYDSLYDMEQETQAELAKELIDKDTENLSFEEVKEMYAELGLDDEEED